jgi:hypothetical protein
MGTIVASLFSNSELRIIYRDDKISQCTDSASKRLDSYRADIIDKAESINCLLRRNPDLDEFLIYTGVFNKRSNGYEVVTRSELERRLSNYQALLSERSPREPASAGALDYIDKSQASSPSKDSVRPWGSLQSPKKFTKNARYRIRRYGSAIERFLYSEHGTFKNCSRFLTLTLPSDSPAAFQALANWSGWLMNNRILQFIRDFERRSLGYPGRIAWFFVWEFQKRGALHLHLFIADILGDESIIAKLAYKIRDLWYQSLQSIEFKERILGRFVNMFGRWRDRRDIWNRCNVIQKITKSISGYLAKYCSKGANDIDSSKDNRKKRKKPKSILNRKSYFFYPSRWWGASSSIRTINSIWESTVKLENISQDDFQGILDLFNESSILERNKEFYAYDYLIDDSSTGAVFGHGEVLIFYYDFHLFDSIWWDTYKIFSRMRHFNRESEREKACKLRYILSGLLPPPLLFC